MTIRNNFMAEEWYVLTAAPSRVGSAMMQAGKGSMGQIVSESLALADAIGGAGSEQAPNALVQAVLHDLHQPRTGSFDDEAVWQQAPVGAEGVTPARVAALETCHQLAELLAVRALDEAEGYKRWLLEIARRVAASAREGGFLGIGGKRISAEEAALLAELASALGIPPSS